MVFPLHLQAPFALDDDDLGLEAASEAAAAAGGSSSLSSAPAAAADDAGDSSHGITDKFRSLFKGSGKDKERSGSSAGGEEDGAAVAAAAAAGVAASAGAPTTPLTGGAGDGAHFGVLDHDIVLWCGDLNYRISESLSLEQTYAPAGRRRRRG